MVINNFRIVCIIPARSGSKGIPDKNIQTINGKSLINRTIDFAKASNVFDEIIVSSDSNEYAKLIDKTVTFHKRSEILSGDESPINDLILELINYYALDEKYEIFYLLQPTSPFRYPNHIISALNYFFDKNAMSVVGIRKATSDLRITKNLEPNLCLEGFLNDGTYQRRQDFNSFTINGAIYISDIKNFIQTKSFYGEKSYGFLMDEISSIDIDSPLDLSFAEYVSMRFNLE